MIQRVLVAADHVAFGAASGDGFMHMLLRSRCRSSSGLLLGNPFLMGNFLGLGFLGRRRRGASHIVSCVSRNAADGYGTDCRENGKNFKVLHGLSLLMVKITVYHRPT